MCVEGGLCGILSFERLVGVRSSWVGVRSLCVEDAWLCAGHASAVSANASELVRNRARRRPSIDATPSYHAWTAHVWRWTFHWHPLTIIYKTDECVDVRDRSDSDSSVIVNNTCAVHARFMRDSSVISVPRHPKILVNFSTHKPNLCVICGWFVRDRLCDWPFTEHQNIY